MLRSIEELESYPIRATDGEIGVMKDLYFDEKAWVVRYLLVETGNWLSSRRVLIPALSVGRSEWLDNVIEVTITKAQVMHSPDVDACKPASRQHETDYLAYNGYADYWGGAGFREGLLSAGEVAAGHSESDQERGEGGGTHLRSAEAIAHYAMHARDGDIGHLEGLLVDVRTWALRYVIASTSNWLLGDRIVIPVKAIESVNWPDATVSLDLPRAVLKAAPRYDDEVRLDRRQEASIHRYYGQPGYWLNQPAGDVSARPH
ncbi:MAG TPA: PRC-barrel domain-containing protein [Dongiaceae bacterium]|nr:PRC-barrel domain-containing protein [Dongiaceae bacterium]